MTLSTAITSLKMKYTIPALVASSVLALNACSSSSKDETPTDTTGNADTKITSLQESIGSLENTNRLGWLLVFESTTSQQITSFGTFFEIDAQNPQNNPIAELLSEQAGICIVEEFSIETPLIEDQLLNDYTSVSAGEVITLTSAAGSYAELARLSMQTGIGYVNLSDLAYPTPDTLLVSVPGDAFSPAAVSIARPSPVAGLTLSDAQVVDTGAAFQWTASQSNDTLVKFDFDVQGNEDIFVTCTATDTGEFTLPNNVSTDASSLAGTDVQLVFTGATRVRAAATRVDTDLFIVVRSTK